MRASICKRLFLVWLVAGAGSSWAFPAEVVLGNEIVATNGLLEGKRVGLITNPSGVNRRLETTVDVLRNARGVKLAALFAPEHGVYGDIPAGREFTNRTDGRTGLPIYSLYGPGAVRKPSRAAMRGLDMLLYDIQDTGCRSYTFISTMGLAMEACGEAGVEFVVLDRPNPLGGERVEGPLLDSRFRSFVGRWNIPYVYGMTCGELARMINGERWITNTCRLSVVPMQGWRRTMVWRDTGLAWLPTSPHIPHGESPLYQVATGMLGEIGGLNIGVGYTLPFQCAAAPWLDGERLANWLNGQGLGGVRFLPTTYTPYYGGYKGQEVRGVQVFFTDPAHAPLTAINFHILEAVKRVSGHDLFAEAIKARKSFEMFDKVNGTDATRKAIQAGTSARKLASSWKEGEDRFRVRREKYLLYPSGASTRR